MSYEEIKAKYAPKVDSRNAAVSEAESNVMRIQTQIVALTKEREQYRMVGNMPTAESSQKWSELSMKLNDLNKELEDAKRSLSTAQIGAEGMDAIRDAVANMRF